MNVFEFDLRPITAGPREDGTVTPPTRRAALVRSRGRPYGESRVKCPVLGGPPRWSCSTRHEWSARRPARPPKRRPNGPFLPYGGARPLSLVDGAGELAPPSPWRRRRRRAAGRGGPHSLRSRPAREPCRDGGSGGRCRWWRPPRRRPDRFLAGPLFMSGPRPPGSGRNQITPAFGDDQPLHGRPSGESARAGSTGSSPLGIWLGGS